MTTTLSDKATSSGRSEESRIIDTPSSASFSIVSWISFFALTSTPRVGSSRISTFGFVESHLASNVFCWLPPDKFDVSIPGSGG